MNKLKFENAKHQTDLSPLQLPPASPDPPQYEALHFPIDFKHFIIQSVTRSPAATLTVAVPISSPHQHQPGGEEGRLVSLLCGAHEVHTRLLERLHNASPLKHLPVVAAA